MISVIFLYGYNLNYWKHLVWHCLLVWITFVELTLIRIVHVILTVFVKTLLPILAVWIHHNIIIINLLYFLKILINIHLLIIIHIFLLLSLLWLLERIRPIILLLLGRLQLLLLLLLVLLCYIRHVHDVLHILQFFLLLLNGQTLISKLFYHLLLILWSKLKVLLNILVLLIIFIFIV